VAGGVILNGMAKDPAFLLYPGDYLGGTMGFSLEQHGAYFLCLILQFNSGPFTEQQAKSIVGDIWKQISYKFKEKNGLFFSKRLAFEIEKRASYCDSRRLNRLKSKIKDEKHMKNICETSVEHMENENEDRNKDKNKDKNKIEIPDHLKEIWHRFLEMRKTLRKAPTQYAQELLIKKLYKLSPNAETQIKIIQQSIENSYQGLFPLKNEQQKYGKQSIDPDILKAQAARFMERTENGSN
jgi:uncharacterized protein YdaU (DUF1376 family)